MMEDGLIGEIRLFAGNFAPSGWEFCSGQTLSIDQNEALFSILGTQYGGDGKVNFQLPNLAPLKEADGGQTPILYIICLEGRYPTEGSYSVTDPLIGQTRLFAGSFAPSGWAFCDGKNIPIAQNQALETILRTQYGGDGKVNFQLPNLAPLKEADGGQTPIRYIIALEGIYPRRP